MTTREKELEDVRASVKAWMANADNHKVAALHDELVSISRDTLAITVDVIAFAALHDELVSISRDTGLPFDSVFELLLEVIVEKKCYPLEAVKQIERKPVQKRNVVLKYGTERTVLDLGFVSVNGGAETRQATWDDVQPDGISERRWDLPVGTVLPAIVFPPSGEEEGFRLPRRVICRPDGSWASLEENCQ